ncbi:MAG: uroporphyrinogen-III synthase [Acidobacteriota bacterium]
MSSPATALTGRTLIVTRPRERASDLADRLERLGAKVHLAPVISPAPPDDWVPLDLAIARLSQYQWVVFTSPQGVESFVDRLFHQGADVRAVSGARLAAIGCKTAERLQEYGLRADLVPAIYKAEELAAALIGAGVSGHAVLVPRSGIARPVLVETLARAGAFVDEVASYSIAPASALPPSVVKDLQQGKVDMVTFTSSSTVEHFVALTNAAGLAEQVASIDIGCIGPITAETVFRHGLRPQVVAEKYTIEGLVEAIVGFYG